MLQRLGAPRRPRRPRGAGPDLDDVTNFGAFPALLGAANQDSSEPPQKKRKKAKMGKKKGRKGESGSNRFKPVQTSPNQFKPVTPSFPPRFPSPSLIRQIKLRIFCLICI
ncbi:uncharacterized protein RBU47_011699 [Passerculus sandwichensis]